VSCLFPHSFIDFLRPKDLLAVRKRAAHALTDRIRIFALERQNVSQKASMRSSIGFPAVPPAGYATVRL
jgi:hypothetical protein